MATNPTISDYDSQERLSIESYVPRVSDALNDPQVEMLVLGALESLHAGVFLARTSALVERAYEDNVIGIDRRNLYMVQVGLAGEILKSPPLNLFTQRSGLLQQID